MALSATDGVMDRFGPPSPVNSAGSRVTAPSSNGDISSKEHSSDHESDKATIDNALSPQLIDQKADCASPSQPHEAFGGEDDASLQEPPQQIHDHMPPAVSSDVRQETEGQKLSVSHGKPLPNPIPSIWQGFVNKALNEPDHLALVIKHQKANLYGLSNIVADGAELSPQSYLRWSYGEFAKGVARLADALQKRGAKENYPVFIVSNNGAEYELIFFAAASLGCRVVPIHPRNLLNEAEAVHVIKTAVSSCDVEGCMVFTQTDELAQKVKELNVLDETQVFVLEASETKEDHASFEQLLSSGEPGDAATLQHRFSESALKWSLIIFTSGTTALPKGVLHYASGIDEMIASRLESLPISKSEVCLLSVPNNHIFLTIIDLTYHSCGAAVVIPGPAFIAADVFEAITSENCTHLPATPTMVYALAQVCKEQNYKPPSLKHIFCGGSKLSVENVLQCFDDVGAKTVEVIYGQTEGGVLTSSTPVSSVDAVNSDGDITIGYASPGTIFRVCEPDSDKILPVNVEGELQGSGSMFSRAYLGDQSPPAWYTDEEGREWIASGDAAKIDEKGRIFIVGRVKEMVIRGGVNISPAAIEFVLAREPRTASFAVQIVGRPDSIGGEILVAVLSQPFTPDDIQLIQDVVLKQMGSIFVPSEFLLINDVGLKEIPRTLLGKAQKLKLKRIVEEHYAAQEASDQPPMLPKEPEHVGGEVLDIPSHAQPDEHRNEQSSTHANEQPNEKPNEQPNQANQETEHIKPQQPVEEVIERRDSEPRVQLSDEIAEKMQKIWVRTIGHQVDLEAPVTSFADSISVMRVRDRIFKDLGVNLSLSEVLGTKTAAGLALLIQDRREVAPAHKAKSTAELGLKAATMSLEGTVKQQDILHLRGDTQLFDSTKAYISQEIGGQGFSWEDVQAVMPASDFTQILAAADILNTSWSWKFAFHARKGIDKNALRKGVEALVTNNPMLASFLFWNQRAFGSDLALHVLLKPNDRMFDRICHDYGTIATKKEFSDEVYKPHEYAMSMFPGILVQFLFFDITETGQAGVIMVAHHSPSDASYMQAVFDDFDKALGDPATLRPHTPYKTWADSYHSLRDSLEATHHVRWHVSRLLDLSQQRPSVFPPLPRPHHFLASTQHIQTVDDNGYHTDFHAKGIKHLRRAHPSLPAPSIIKAAWSLMNIHRNGTKTALFSNLQADRRRFPFIPPVLESLAPPEAFSAADVAGPTLQDVVNIIHLDPHETALEFMLRVNADQEELNIHAAAPLKRVLSEIGPVNGETMLDVLRSQIFNWTPGLGAMQIQNPNEHYETLSSFIRPSLRLVINVDVGGIDDETVYAQVKSPLYDRDGLIGLARDFEDFVLWLCDEQNWSAKMENFKQALRKEDDPRNFEVKERKDQVW